MARVLLVEDDQYVAAAVEAILEHAGHEVTWILNGRTALELHEQAPFDLVVCDMIMPEFDGIETILLLQNASRPVPIIAMTGSPNLDADFLLEMATDFGTVATFKKPLATKPFLDKVAEIVSPA